MKSSRSVLLPKTIFIAGMKMAPGTDRESFLNEACYDDPTLRQRVDQLIQARNSLVQNPLDIVVKLMEPNATLYAAPEFLAFSNELDGTIDVSTHPFIGPYKLLELLGQGGMGAVYMAEQQHPVKRMVALKIIRPGMDSREVIGRFEAERQALAMMDHPHIARVLEAGTTANMRPYFAMELVRGIPITDYVEKKQLSVRERLQLFVKVCGAVQHAHQKGIIHRDLKPSNILVTHRDGEPVPKVIDFGVSKALDQRLSERTLFTQFSQMIGTPLYMSPEQAEMSEQDIDTRSDIYSLGVLLYELLTGSTPFDKQTFATLSYDEIRKVIRLEEPPRPSLRLSTLGHESKTTVHVASENNRKKLQQTLRRELDWIAMKALSKDREQRYKTASEFGDDVQRYLVGQPVVACPPSLLYRSRKFCSRYLACIIFLSLLGFSILVGGGIAISQAMRAMHAEHAAGLREREAQDLLEAARIQQLLAMFRDRNYSQISELNLPLDKGQFAGELQASSNAGSLRNLLKDLGKPQPEYTMKHPEGVNDISVSADRKHLLTGCRDGSAYLWDLPTGELIRTFSPHLAAVDAVCFSPSGDYLATGTQNGQVWVWHLDSSTPLKLLGTFPTGVETLIWSPDGSTLAAGARYSEVRVWNRDFEEIIRFKNDHRHESLLYSQDGRKLFIPTQTEITVWDIGQAKQIQSLTTGPLSNVRTMCWDGPNQNYILCADRFSESMIVLNPQLNRVESTFTNNIQYPQHLDINEEGTRLATVHEDGTFHIYAIHPIRPDAVQNLRNANLVQLLAHDSLSGRASVAKFIAPNRVVTAGMDGDVNLWNLNRNQPVTLLKPPVQLSFLLPASENELISITETTRSSGSSLVRFDLSGRLRPTKDASCQTTPVQVGPPSEQGWYPVLFRDKIEIRDLESGRVQGEIPCSTGRTLLVNLSPNGKRLAATTVNGTIELWESETQWSQSRNLGTIPFKPSWGICFTNDGRTLIADNGMDLIVEWDIERRIEQQRYPLQMGKKFSLSPRGDFLTIAEDKGVRVIHRPTQKVLMERSFHSRVTALLICDNERILLTGHRDGRIRVWHLPTQEGLGILFEPLEELGSPEMLSFLDSTDRLLIYYKSNKSIQENARIVILGVDSRQ